MYPRPGWRGGTAASAPDPSTGRDSVAGALGPPSSPPRDVASAEQQSPSKADATRPPTPGDATPTSAKPALPHRVDASMHGARKGDIEILLDAAAWRHLTINL